MTYPPGLLSAGQFLVESLDLFPEKADADAALLVTPHLWLSGMVVVRRIALDRVCVVFQRWTPHRLEPFHVYLLDRLKPLMLFEPRKINEQCPNQTEALTTALSLQDVPSGTYYQVGGLRVFF